jgi:hypothetical protein
MEKSEFFQKMDRKWTDASDVSKIGPSWPMGMH